MGIFDKVMDDWLGDPFGTYEAESGARAAADQQVNAANEAIARQEEQYQQSRQDLAPFVESGLGGVRGLQSFAQDRDAAVDPLKSTILSGERARGGIEALGGSGQVPHIQQLVRSGAGAMPNLEGYSAAGQAGLGGIDRYARDVSGAPSGLEQYSEAGQGSVPILQQYAQSGAPALEMQQALAGTLGPEAQQAAYEQVESSPEVQYMMDKAKEGILSGGSATGNLRAGRTKAALAEMNPAILSQAIRDKYSQLGQLSSMGGQYASDLARTGAGIDQYRTGLGAGLEQYRTGLGAGVDQYRTGMGADAARYLTDQAAGANQYLTSAGTNVAQNLYGGSQAAQSQLASLGQASAAGQAGAAQNFGANQANLIGQRGAAQAGGQLARGSGSSWAADLGGAALGGYLGGGGQFGGFSNLGKQIKGFF